MRVTVIVLVTLFPLQDIVIVLGSTIVHAKIPDDTEVVGGITISNLPPASIAVIIVENKVSVVTELTVVSALETPTLDNTSANEAPRNHIAIMTTLFILNIALLIAILNLK